MYFILQKVFLQDILDFFPLPLTKFFSTLKLASVKKLSSKPNANDTLQDNTNATPIASPYLHSLKNHHTLQILPQNFRNAISAAEHILHNNNPQNIDDT